MATAGKKATVSRLPANSNKIPTMLRAQVNSVVSNIVNGVRFYFIEVATVDLFSIPRNINQRDEEIRNSTHLKILQVEHLEVAALVDPYSGRFALINGHTRVMEWKNNPAIRPDKVIVKVYEITDPLVRFEDEELRLYNSYDSRRAVKSAPDTVQGVLNKLGIDFSTRWMRAGHISEGVKVAARLDPNAPDFNKVGIEPLIAHFRKELELLDTIGPRKSWFIVAFLATALIALKHDPKMIDVFADYQDRASSADKFANKGSLSAAGKGNGLYWLYRLRENGIDGNRKFGTGNGEAERVALQALAYVIAAHDNPTTLYPHPAPLRPSQVKKLLK